LEKKPALPAPAGDVGLQPADLILVLDGDDRLNGAAGNDQLQGGAGNNARFVGSIGLDSRIFAELGTGVDAGEFVAGAAPTALEPDDHLLCNTTTGALRCDIDGSGTADPLVEIAVLSGAPDLAAADFFLGQFVQAAA
jgi:Ca2+-binding RTX toxin-like protein